MSRKLHFTEDTKIAFEPTEISDVHLNDLSFILDVETDGDEVTRCDIDLHRLVQAMVLYSSMERFRYGWRRAPR